MKYYTIKWYTKGRDKSNYANYRGVMSIQRETKEQAEEFAISQAGKSKEYTIDEITKEQYSFFQLP